MRSPIEPAEAAPLLRWVKISGFAAWHLIDADKPELIVLYREWAGWLDVVHLRGPDRVEAARLHLGERADIWRPREVVWHHYSEVVQAITALRNLSEHAATPYEPPRDGDPLPLYVTDDELAAKRHYFPPDGYPLPAREV